MDGGAMIAHSILVPTQKSTGLRIIAGAYRGRRLAAPPGLATRPLPDRVKQALFDWLGQRLDGLRVADCCAGSGAFTFEALSRGATRAFGDGVEACQDFRRRRIAGQPRVVQLQRPIVQASALEGCTRRDQKRPPNRFVVDVRLENSGEHRRAFRRCVSEPAIDALDPIGEQ